MKKDQEVYWEYRDPMTDIQLSRFVFEAKLITDVPVDLEQYIQQNIRRKTRWLSIRGFVKGVVAWIRQKIGQRRKNRGTKIEQK